MQTGFPDSVIFDNGKYEDLRIRMNCLGDGLWIDQKDDYIVIGREQIPALIGALLNAYCGKVPA